MDTRIWFKALLIAAALTTVAACAQYLRSDVVSFHEDELPQGETIRIEAADPAKADSLEFRSYSTMIAEQLRKLGYMPQLDPDADAVLIAEVDYSVMAGGSETRTTRRMAPSVRYHFYYGDYLAPFYFGLSDSWDEDVTTTPAYVRQLSLNIVRNNTERTHLFEGRVRSSGRQGELAQVMPYLVTALFSNFPGESGVTKVVTIEMDE